MTNERIGTISLKCLFCGCILKGPTSTRLQSGDLIKCLNCGEENDYDSLMSVAKEEGLEIARKQIDNMLKKIFK
ncbi:hypothetical protein LQ759_09055 [Serratia marcescens]|nr:hypothetical protein [Serratia marcescens]